MISETRTNERSPTLALIILSLTLTVTLRLPMTSGVDGSFDPAAPDEDVTEITVYDGAGRLATVARANGAVTTYGYDGADRLRDLHTTVNDAAVSQFSYATDRVGTRTVVTETVGLTETRVLSTAYDGLGRLIGAVEAPGTTTSYAYDLVGNRTGVWVDGTRTVTQSFNAANQVVGWSYDAAGNLLSDGTNAYGYDPLNRMVAHNGTSYGYNGDGVLVAAGTTRYVQDVVAPLSQILADGSATYVYGHERLAAVQGGTRTWSVGDALGSVRLVLDDGGAPLRTVQYDPWGVPERGTPAPFGFTGELHSQGLVYLRARWYDGSAGTFTQRDPFGGFPEQPYSLHPYQYGYANPGRWTDASGESVPLPKGIFQCPFSYFPERDETTGELRCIRPDWLMWLPGPDDTRPNTPEEQAAALEQYANSAIMPPVVSVGSSAVGVGVQTLPRLGLQEGTNACVNLIVGILIWTATQNVDDNGLASSLDDYPANPDEWVVPEGWVETPAGEKTGGKHRQWRGPQGEWRRWDREGREGGKKRGPHWHDWRNPGKHIETTR